MGATDLSRLTMPALEKVFREAAPDRAIEQMGFYGVAPRAPFKLCQARPEQADW
jgi:hypothetical protein